MLRRAFVLLLGTSGLSGCVSRNTGAPPVLHQAPGAMPVAPRPGGAGANVAILLPLTGPRAEIGRSMMQAAQLALAFPGAPVPDIKDTGGNPDGASEAARTVIAAGAQIILGPLSSGETARVAPIARRAGVPVLAFTNDPAQAQPGVWPLGITPDQQIFRLVGVLRESRHEPIAALLPDDDLGKAMADALIRITGAEGMTPPFIRLHGSGREAIEAVVSEMIGLGAPDQPLPFGAILLGSYGGDLRAFAKAFADAKIDRSKVQIAGPALWADPGSGALVLPGAWFAGADPDARRDLIKDYSAKYREAPRPVADLAYDAASIARVLAERDRLTMQGLTEPLGFAGVDGWFALMPDGQVRRGLAVFRVEKAQPEKIYDAPAGPSAAAG